MKLDTLYKRTKTGAIQYYSVWTDTVDSAGNEFAVIFKESGQLGTDKPIIHKEEVKEGKNLNKSNATNPQQQAELQAKSDWLKKKDSGYKSLEDFGFVMGNPLPANPEVQIACFLEGKLPQFNSGVGNIPMPMLATDWGKVKNITYPCYIQPKLDGVRCLMIVEADEVKFLSRSGKEYTTLDHIKEDVLKYASPGNIPSLNFILDGEIYNHDSLSFQAITSAVKKQSPDSLKLQFRVYDIVNDDKQEARLHKVMKLVESINSPLITMVETHKIHYKEDVKGYHDNFVQAGYEGAMLRLFDGIYGQGQRSRHLLKVKEFDETEFHLLSFETGQRSEDLIAVCQTKEGNIFRAKMIGTVSEKLEMQSQAGTMVRGDITIKHFGWTEGDSKVPRFPIGKGFRNY